MSGDEPFYVQHGPFERETMRPPPAQPPEYDLAFVFRADERIMWPIEAKVLETPGGVADYVRDIREEYLKCRYGPFSASGAMLAYLLDRYPGGCADINRSPSRLHSGTRVNVPVSDRIGDPGIEGQCPQARPIRKSSSAST